MRFSSFFAKDGEIWQNKDAIDVNSREEFQREKLEELRNTFLGFQKNDV